MSTPPSPPSPWRIMAPVRGRIRLAMALSCAACVCTLAALLALAAGVRALSLAQSPWLALTVAGLATGAALALRRLAFDQSHDAAFRLERLLRSQLCEHIARWPMGQVQTAGAAALAKVVFDDVKALHVFVADSTPLYARALFMPALTLVLLLWLDWRLALAAVAVLAAGLAVLAGILRGRADIMRRYQQAREQVSAAIVEYVQAMPVVRSFDSGQVSFGRYQHALDHYLATLSAWWEKTGLAAKAGLAVLNPMPTLAVLLGVGAWALTQGTLEFSTWIAVLLLGTGMAEALTPLHNLGHMIDTAKLSTARIQEILAAPVLPQPVNTSTATSTTTSATPQDASVVFEQVSFRYEGAQTNTLAGISFTAAPGSISALVGASGAGKSTVLHLLTRDWDVSAGRVLVGGVDVRALPQDTLMGHIATVSQDSFLFAASVAENIGLGAPTASEADIEAAARAAQAHDFIQTLPQGYATPVGERGVFLSGGQRQRIAVARALLQNRPILLLDEPTAFADAENEAALIAALAQLMRGKTVLMVTHRLASVRDADQLLVFEAGRLAEHGPHETLLAADGVYARLWRNQQRAQDWVLRGASP